MSDTDQITKLSLKEYKGYVQRNLEANPKSAYLSVNDSSDCERLGSEGVQPITYCSGFHPTERPGVVGGRCKIGEEQGISRIFNSPNDPASLRMLLPGVRYPNGVTTIHCPRGIVAPREGDGFIQIFDNNKEKFISLCELAR